MKSILLAAAAMIAVPAIAQDAAPQTPPADPAATMPAPTDPAATPPADPAAAAPASADQSAAPMTPATTTSTPTDPAAAASAGGYQPSAPAVSGTPAPGSTVRFQQAPDPATAYPAPAAEANYPICKKGQFDGCMQASDAGAKRKKKR